VWGVTDSAHPRPVFKRDARRATRVPPAPLAPVTSTYGATRVSLSRSSSTKLATKRTTKRESGIGIFVLIVVAIFVDEATDKDGDEE
jgi:hypothetical protein